MHERLESVAPKAARLARPAPLAKLRPPAGDLRSASLQAALRPVSRSVFTVSDPRGGRFYH
jgi:hypothetical protein